PIADELGQGMERLGVQLLVGRYYNDPAVFFPEDGRARFLADYETGRNGYLLLIFSSTSELSANRQTLEALARWPHMAWMQLRTDSFQAGSSRYGIANYPASKAGLLAAFTRFLTETGSLQKVRHVSCHRAELRGDVAISSLLETRLADALPWAQACSILQPTPLGLADCLRRTFFAHLPPESIERFMALPGTSLGKGGFSFSDLVLKELRRGFQVRCSEERRKTILERVLAELEKTWQEEYGDQAEDSLARLAWQKYYQLVNLQLKPDQALKGIAELEGSPLGSVMKADLAMIDPDPLREKLGDNKDALQRLARLFGKRSGLSLLKRYPLGWFQWVGAGILVLSLLTASGSGVQKWLAAGQGEARLSVLAEQGGGTGWVGVEESGASLEKRSDTEGLLRLPVETLLPLRKSWQLVFYDHALQPVHTVELGRISDNQLVRLEYEKAETQGETGELVVTDKQGNVLVYAEVTVRSSLFTNTARADRTLVLPVGEYEFQVENSKGIGTAWQKISVSNDAKKVEEFEPTWFRDPLQDGGLGPAMVPIEGGSFRMGDIQGLGQNDEKPVHEVSVDAFALGRHEVTVGEFRAFIEQSGYQLKENSGCYVDQDKTGDWEELEAAGWDRPFFAQSDDQPVVCVSWEDATAYAQWLSEQTGQQYRLPTEAEWEYAARAGTETIRYWGDDADDACGFANVGDIAFGLYYPSKKKGKHNCLDGWIYTAPTGSLDPNGFSLYDMMGNAWEWTADWYDEKYYAVSPAKGPVTNPQGPTEGTGTGRVFRGGGLSSFPVNVRSAFRMFEVPAYRNFLSGFRLVRTNPQPSGPFTLLRTRTLPIPSDFEEISQHFLDSHKHATLADVGDALQTALENEGFKTTYFAVPEGFALVSNVDDFQSSFDGTPIPPNATIASNFQRLFNSLKEPSSYFKLLSGSPKQQFYQVVVIVTSGDIWGQDQMTFKEAQDLITLGGTSIPNEMKTKRYDKEKYKCMALLYAFEKDPSGDEIRFVPLTDNRIDIRNYLQQTGFWDKP
ncbi:formylglycine-generating enzyme family protein, partial [Desulfobulbus sp. TB]|nr:formylglycine-generating enzyme family protein [Desulfobulbus sp. TB]